tara:strand:+ start:95 stop:625 length:531 start_codon:yes stop_codon:yes gene_type:complete
MKNYDSIAKMVNKQFNFHNVKISEGELLFAKIEGDLLTLVINKKDRFFNDDFKDMLIIREIYRAMYNYDGIIADIIANKSAIKNGFDKELADYYYLLLTERKNKKILSIKEFIEIHIAYFSFLGLDEDYANMFMNMRDFFTFSEVMMEKTADMFKLFRDPYKNFDILKKEIDIICT